MQTDKKKKKKITQAEMTQCTRAEKEALFFFRWYKNSDTLACFNKDTLFEFLETFCSHENMSISV